jgi:hypothetical protein
LRYSKGIEFLTSIIDFKLIAQNQQKMINKEIFKDLKRDCLFLDLKDLPKPLEYQMIHYFTTRLTDEAYKTNIASENKELLEINTFLTYNREKLFINDKGDIECSFIGNTEKLNSLKNKTVNKIIKELKKRIITIKTTDSIYKKLGLDVIVEKLKELQEKEKDLENREKELNKKIISKSRFKIAIHTVSQFYGDNKQLSLFTDEKINSFVNDTGLNLHNRPNNYGVVLNQTQQKVFEGIIRAFTDTNYKGHELTPRVKALGDVYLNTPTSAEVLTKKDNSPYKNIDFIPTLKLTQAEIIELSGYDLKKQRQGDKQDVVQALSFLATNQFCFYWTRTKEEKGKFLKDKKGAWVKEEVMEVGTLLRVKTIRDQTGLLQYYEILPSAPLLDQVNNYFLLVPVNWRDEVKQLTGKKPSSYTYEFLLWLRLQFEQIRRYNTLGGKKRKKKPFKINIRWEEIAVALKMPESMYKRNRERSYKIIQQGYDSAIKLGYLLKVDTGGGVDSLYLNESYYPKPGELT